MNTLLTNQTKVLRRIYETKLGQLAQAKSCESSLRYHVLKAEADAIKAQLDAVAFC